MRKLLLSLVLLLGALGVARPVAAQSADCFQGQTFVGVPQNKETLTVSSTALPLTASVYKPTNGQPQAMSAVMVVTGDSIRFWVDGTAPTAAVGMLVAAGSSITVCQAGLAKFQMIRVTTDATVSISYFSAP